MSGREQMRERDRAALAKHGLAFCEACGWAKLMHHNCRPDAGRLADAIADAFPEGNPTKAGYGSDVIAFELDENLHVQFRIAGDLSIRLDDIFDLNDHTIEAAAQIGKFFRGWARPGYKPGDE